MVAAAEPWVLWVLRLEAVLPARSVPGRGLVLPALWVLRAEPLPRRTNPTRKDSQDSIAYEPVSLQKPWPYHSTDRPLPCPPTRVIG